MAGYATQARLDGATLRLALIGAHAAPPEPRPEAPAGEWLLVADPVELVGRPVDDRIGAWLASIVEAWSQLTFFLFDPESWR